MLVIVLVIVLVQVLVHVWALSPSSVTSHQPQVMRDTLPSAMSCMRVCATAGLTLSPASSNTRTTVRTYQEVEGANLSAH